MKQFVFTTSLIMLGFVAFSQNTRQQYIAKYQLLAIQEMNRSGIPASIKMAQACLESANGNSELSRKSNNHFGIKCKKNWKGKKVYYDDDRKNECFRKYKSVEDSYIDHTNFLMNNPRYASLFALKTDDYKGWARGLKKAGYATAKHYDKRLIEIIEKNKLHRLDLKISQNEIAVYENMQFQNPNFSSSLTINPFYSREIRKINGLEAVIARKNDTYQLIALETGKKDWELRRFNEVQRGYEPMENEVVYIQNKKRKTAKNIKFHTVQPGETLYFIAQKYGIKLRPLYFRNRMKINEPVYVGQKISLRKRIKKSN
jgi:hypothetical protein